ncbi:MAG: hypothetical protein D6731_10170, partial [Planctomycetota bacterium]
MNRSFRNPMARLQRLLLAGFLVGAAGAGTARAQEPAPRLEGSQVVILEGDPLGADDARPWCRLEFRGGSEPTLAARALRPEARAEVVRATLGPSGILRLRLLFFSPAPADGEEWSAERGSAWRVEEWSLAGRLRREPGKPPRCEGDAWVSLAREGDARLLRWRGRFVLLPGRSPDEVEHLLAISPLPEVEPRLEHADVAARDAFLDLWGVERLPAPSPP